MVQGCSVQMYSCSPAPSSVTAPEPPGAIAPVRHEPSRAAFAWVRSVGFVHVTRGPAGTAARVGVRPYGSCHSSLRPVFSLLCRMIRCSSMLAGLELPQLLPAALVVGAQGAVDLGVEHQAALGGHGAAAVAVRPPARVLPGNAVRAAVERHVQAVLPRPGGADGGAGEEPRVLGALDPARVDAGHAEDVAGNRAERRRREAHGHVGDELVRQAGPDRIVVAAGLEAGRDHVRVDAFGADLVRPTGNGCVADVRRNSFAVRVAPRGGFAAEGAAARWSVSSARSLRTFARRSGSVPWEGG